MTDCVYGCCVSLADADNYISDAGAVALAKALESGQCQLKRLHLNGESTLLPIRLHRLSGGTMCAPEGGSGGR